MCHSTYERGYTFEGIEGKRVSGGICPQKRPAVELRVEAVFTYFRCLGSLLKNCDKSSFEIRHHSNNLMYYCIDISYLAMYFSGSSKKGLT